MAPEAAPATSNEEVALTAGAVSDEEEAYASPALRLRRWYRRRNWCLQLPVLTHAPLVLTMPMAPALTPALTMPMVLAPALSHPPHLTLPPALSHEPHPHALSSPLSQAPQEPELTPTPLS